MATPWGIDPMDPKLMLTLITGDLERRRGEEFEATFRRPDALPLPPEEPAPTFGDRLSAVLTGWLHRLPSEPVARMARGDDEVTAV
jgi:broad specificity phosphatase PhoE